MQFEKKHFLLNDISPFQGRAWIPLHQVVRRESKTDECEIAEYEAWAGTGTAAVWKDKRADAEKISWDELGVQPQRSYVEYGEYRPVDLFRTWQGNELGLRLVIVQSLDDVDAEIWHLHHDLVVALRLIRENDSWLCPKDQFREVARISRDPSGKPELLEIRKEYLVDYLAARNMDLYSSSYYERRWCTETRPDFTFESEEIRTDGAETREAYIRAGRYPFPEGSFVTLGALWRTEWVLSGVVSSRVRGDPEPANASFVIDVDGNRTTAKQLPQMAYLYFDPAVVDSVLRHRGSKFGWYTGETGAIGAAAAVHFGINDLGLVVVFAKDIGQLPQAEQRIWSAFSVTPEGGNSKELFSVQMMLQIPDTKAPEAEIEKILGLVNDAFIAKYDKPLLLPHASVPSLLKKIHRFVAVDESGILELSKDVTRLFVERLNQDALMIAVNLDKNENRPASLKLLEKMLSRHIEDDKAKKVMSPLFGIYDLRLADAHLGTSRIESGKLRAGVDENVPAPMQGRQLLQSFCDSLNAIATVLT
ncbi:hypothetical protein [Agrobacterium sp. fls2-241-TYG-188a]|uniref:hypothetical protein n=1 Tax=Agrobacterium sp. fls2-241-TYG-188a TaxID=3040275 RepID=UPI00254EA4AB|nr:hypothetical protein [Agrobacterium sp. fls2-241-TYG-188a]